MNRRHLTGLVAAALLPTMAAVVLVRPAVGQDRAYGFYALTMSGGSAFYEGEIGAGGGLTALDGGAPFATARLDSSPSSAVRAAPVEPGALVRTLNAEGGTGIDIPLAEAQHPGTAEGRVEGSGDQDLGGLAAGSGGTAVVTAGPTAVTANATGASQVVVPGGAAAAARLTEALAPLRTTAAGLGAGSTAAADEGTIVTEGAEVDGSATADPAGELTATFRSTVSSVTVLGEIRFSGIEGVATATTLPDGTREADAATTISEITVAGMPVGFGADGLEVLGETVIPGSDVQAASELVTNALTVAGITIEPLSPVEVTEDGAARADSRGVRVTIVNPGLPEQGVPGDHLTLVLGGASVTVADEPIAAPADPLPVQDTGPPPAAPSEPTPPDPGVTTPAPTAPPPATQSSGATTTTTTTSSGTPALSMQSAPAPVVAPPPVAATAGTPVTEAASPLLVAGRRVDKRLAIAAFGGWQLLSLSVCTAAVFAMRRRRELEA